MKTFAIAATALTTLFAFAGEAKAETQSKPFEPSYEDRVSEFPWESSYFPAEGALRIKLGATAWQDLAIDMQGDAQYAWEGDMFGLRGQEDGGDFLTTIGAEITVTIAYDVLGFAGEFEIGVYDISEEVQQAFTPYVLDGAAERPVDAAFELGPYNLADTTFALGSGSGNLNLDFRIDSPGVTFAGTQVDLRTEQGSAGPTASILAADEPVMLGMPGEPGERVQIYGIEHGVIDSEISMHLLPTVTLDIFGMELTAGPFDIELAYPVLEGEPIEFDEVVMEFDIPEAPVPSDDGGDDDGDEPSDDDGDDSGDEPEPSDDDGDEPEPADDGDEDDGDDAEGDDAGAIGGVGEEGCGCSSNGGAPDPLAFGLLGLGLLGLRRRK